MKPFYFDEFLSPDPAEAADFVFEELKALDWLQVTDARKEYFMSDVPRSYAYGKGEHRRTYHSSPYSPLVDQIRADLNEKFAGGYNVCFLNRYDEQKHQLGWHADDSPEMEKDHAIAVVSFGAEREIWWRPKDHKGPIPPEWRQRLGHGSLFVMPPLFQESYQHRIPRADRAVGVRISLTFRKYISPEGN